MTILKIDSFIGMIPRLPSVRLPNNAASYAENCDYRHGELRSLKGPGGKLTTTGIVRTLFTDAVSGFYAWPHPTRVYLSPTIDDEWGRVYYLDDVGQLRAAQRSLMYAVESNPRPPLSQFKVGVKAPSVGSATRSGLIGVTITAQLMRDGALVRELDVTDRLQILDYWETYSLTMDASFTADFVDAPVAGDQSVADGDGYVVGPDAAVIYFNEPVEEVLSGDAGDVVTHWNAGATALAAGRWRVNSHGRVQRRDSAGGAWYPGAFSSSVASGVTYKGRTYAPTSDLFTALQDGTAAAPIASDHLNESRVEGLSFRAKIWFTADNRTFYDGEMSYVAGGTPNEYILSVPTGIRGRNETVAVCATTVNIIGEESHPSPTVTLEWRDNGTERLTYTIIHTPEEQQIPLAGVNFYRTYTGQQNTEFFLINPDPIPFVDGIATVNDESKSPPTATTLQTYDWDEPPTGLTSLCYAGNGSLVAAKGKELIFSEPYRAHAWPYRMIFPSDIVGIIEIEGGLLVTTKTKPYLVYGAHPEQMSQQQLNAEQAGVSWRAMARVEGAAVYASNDGLVRVKGAAASVEESKQIFTPEVWRSIFSEAYSVMSMCAWDDQLIAVVEGGVSFIIRLDDQSHNTVLSIPGETLTGVVVSAELDRVGLLYNNGFAAFGFGDDMALTWWSKEFEYPRPVDFGACVVRHNGSFSLEFWKDGANIYTKTITGAADTPFRLPSVGSGKRWQVRVSGTGSIHSIELGSSFAELQNV